MNFIIEILNKIVSVFPTVIGKVATSVTHVSIGAVSSAGSITKGKIESTVTGTTSSTHGLSHGGMDQRPNLKSTHSIQEIGSGLALANPVISTFFEFSFFLIFCVLLGGLFLCLKRTSKIIENDIINNSTTSSLEFKLKFPIFARFVFSIKVFFYVIKSFLDNFILVFLKHPVFFVSCLTLTFIFIYFGERHLSTTINILSSICDIGINAYNVIGAIAEVVYNLKEFLLPISNMSLRSSILVMTYLWNGVSSAVASADPNIVSTGGGGNRRLDSDFAFSSVTNVLAPFIHIWLTLDNIELYVTQIVIELFFELGLFPILIIVVDIATLALTKVMCAFSGQQCSLLSFISAIVNGFILNLINQLLNAILSIFGATINLYAGGLDCTTATLQSLNVYGECKGSFFSINPYGIFINAADKNSRRLITCYEQSGKFYEEILGGDQDIISSSYNISHACPYTKNSLESNLGHNRNLIKLESLYDCYHVCINTILIEFCPDDEHVHNIRGKCTPISSVLPSTPITMKEVRRKLKYFPFDSKRFIIAPYPPPPPHRKERQLFSWTDIPSDSLRSAYKNNPCNINLTSTSVIGDIFEVISNAICIINSIVTNNGKSIISADELIEQITQGSLDINNYHNNKGRGLSTSINAGGILGKMLNRLHYEIHSFKIEKYKTVLNKKCSDLGMYDCFGLCIKNLDSCNQKNKTLSLDHSKIVIRESLDKYSINPRRRSLDDDFAWCTEQDGLYTCANGYQCVTNLDLCNSAASGSTVSILSYIDSYLQDGGQYILNFDPVDMLFDIYTCWNNGILDPTLDPYSFQNEDLSQEEIEKHAIYCFPLFKPSSWEFTPYHFSFKQYMLSYCDDPNFQDYEACVCPMFYSLTSVSYPIARFWDEGFFYILLNGVIAIKDLFGYILDNWPGYAWSWVCHGFICGTTLSNGLYVSSYNQLSFENYYLCYTLHIGSVCTLLLFLFGSYLTINFFWDVGNYIITYGETIKRQEYRDFEYIISEVIKRSRIDDKKV